MRRVLEALRLAFDQRRSQRKISLALGVSQRTVSGYRRRFAPSGLPWPVPVTLDKATLFACQATSEIPQVPTFETPHPGCYSACSGCVTGRSSPARRFSLRR
jgi:hypothetical protein